MSFDVLNPWMLAGLAGIALPVIAHLLSRKKYDVVQWGAMQFLELGRQAKRRIRLEEFLLLALRMGLISLIAIAMARPWLSGSMVSNFSAAPTSDYVIVIDSSYSSDWRGSTKTPHQQAVRWATQFLNELSPSDTVAVLDARDQVEPVVPTLTRDRELVRKTLENLPTPSGTSKLHESVIRGVQLLSSGTALSRHVIVVTDGQQLPWRHADAHFWLQMDELRKQASVPSDVWVVNTQRQQAKRVNYSLDRLQLSRELTVIDFPVRIKTRLRNSGAPASVNRRVFLEIDGQRLAEQTQSVQIEADGQATIEFEQRFNKVGTHLIAVVTESDNLIADDRAEGVVEISDALPVLLVDGQSHPDATKTETFFAKAALTAPGNPTPWVAAQVINPAQLTANRLAAAQVVLLANVARLTDEQVDNLRQFVESGGGLAITLGDQVDRDWYNSKLFASGDGLLPGELKSLETAPKDVDAEPIGVNSESLQLPWLKAFSTGGVDSLLAARFTHWYRVEPAVADPAVKKPEDDPGGEKPKVEAPPRMPASAIAKLSTGDPWIVHRPLGRGGVSLLTSTLDADWTTLPAKPDYVAFLHEMIFDLTASRISRNVDVGTSLIAKLEPNDRVENWHFVGPAGKEHAALTAGTEQNPQARLDETLTPGTYRLRRKDGPLNANKEQHFVVNFDRAESELTALTDGEWTELTTENRIRRIEQPTDLFTAIKSETARVETWHLLMLLFLAILVGEVVMTRRLVQGGHVFTDDVADA